MFPPIDFPAVWCRIIQVMMEKHSNPGSQFARRFVTRSELESITGIRPKTWAKYALLGKGPIYKIIGGRARYELTQIEKWLASCPAGVRNKAGGV